MNCYFCRFLIVLLLFYSCSETKEQTIKRVYANQKKAQRFNNDSTYFYLNESKELLNEYKLSDSLKASNDYLYGIYFQKKNKIDSALWYFNKTISYSKGQINSKKEKKYYRNLAEFYKKNGDYLNSLGVLNRLEESLDKTDYHNLATINDQRQRIYILLKNYKKSIEFNKKSIKYFALAKDTAKIINNLILQSSLNYYNFKNTKKAYKLLDSILNIDLQTSNAGNVLKNKIYQTYGVFKYYDKNYVHSYNNYYKALEYLDRPKNKQDSLELANNYASIAEVCIKLKQYDLAKKYNKAIDKLTPILDVNLKNIHLKNKLKLAYDTRADFEVVSSSLYNLTRLMDRNYDLRINKELTTLNNANKKEKTLLITNQNVTINNAELKRKQILLFSILGFLILSTLIGVLYNRQKKLKQQKEEVFLQQRLFRAQMNPHFTSNILYTIHDLMTEDKDKANKYLLKFSKLLRLNLENSMQNYTLVEKEIEVLTKYLDLQQLLFPTKFTYKINTHNLDTDLLSIPPMLIQPFVENAITHGFKDIDYKGLITIDLFEKGKFIFCKITDNGIGLQPLSSKHGTSASTVLIKKLLKDMANQELTIQKNRASKGTTVSFNIPFSIIT